MQILEEGAPVAATMPRSYLREAERRRQLLDAARTLFAREGFAGLTMSALAAEAGVSRRTVYVHLPDLATLYDAFFEDRVAGWVDQLDRARTQAGPVEDDPVAVVRASVRALLEVPAEDQRAIRLLMVEHGSPELAPVRARLRRHVLERWLPAFPAEVPRPLAAGLVWSTAAAVLALADQVERGELTPDEALVLADALATSSPATVALLAASSHTT